MDQNTRGSLEKMLDDFVDNWTRTEDTKVIFDDAVISSEKDLELGYQIGEIAGGCVIVLRLLSKDATDEDMKELLKMVKRRVPELSSKIEMELNK